MKIFIYPCDHCPKRKQCTSYEDFIKTFLKVELSVKVFDIITNIYCINYEKNHLGG